MGRPSSKEQSSTAHNTSRDSGILAYGSIGVSSANSEDTRSPNVGRAPTVDSAEMAIEPTSARTPKTNIRPGTVTVVSMAALRGGDTPDWCIRGGRSFGRSSARRLSSPELRRVTRGVLKGTSDISKTKR